MAKRHLGDASKGPAAFALDVLTQREAAVRLCSEMGLSQREIGDVIHRDHRTVGRILAAGEKKSKK
jgi:DNA-binding NarL/FixJ family response regulator